MQGPSNPHAPPHPRPHLLALLVTCALTSPAVADVVWLEPAGGSGIFEQGTAVAAHPNGGAFLTGYFEHTASFGDTTLTEVSGETVDGFLARYDANGTIDWVRQLAGMDNVSGQCVAADATGSCAVGGSLAGQSSISGEVVDPGPGSRAFLAHFDAAGQIQWLRVNESNAQFPGFALAADVAIDSQGAIVATGEFNQGFDFGTTQIVAEGADWDVWVAKLTAAGDPLWLRHGTNVLAGPPYVDNRGSAIAVGPDDSVWVTGWVDGAADFDGETPPAYGGEDVFLVRYDASGTLQWITTAGGLGQDRANSIAIDDDGNVYVAGRFDGTAIFGSTTLVATGAPDAFVWKLAPDGAHQWAVRAGGAGADDIEGLTLDRDGAVLVSGTVADGGDFGSLLVSGSKGFVARFSPGGVAEWVDASTSGTIVPWDLSALADEIYVAAHFRDTIEWGGFSRTALAGSDILLARFSTPQSTPAPIPAATSLTLRMRGSNPSGVLTTLEYRLPGRQRARLTLHDLRGELVRVLVDRVQGAGVHSATWDGRDERRVRVAAGVYVGRLQTSSGIASLRVIRTR